MLSETRPDLRNTLIFTYQIEYVDVFKYDFRIARRRFFCQALTGERLGREARGEAKRIPEQRDLARGRGYRRPCSGA